MMLLSLQDFISVVYRCIIESLDMKQKLCVFTHFCRKLKKTWKEKTEIPIQVPKKVSSASQEVFTVIIFQFI